MTWLAKTKRLIDAHFKPSCPPFEAALRATEARQFLAAATELKSLDGMQRFFASFVIELRAVALGAAPGELGAMCALGSDLPLTSVDASEIPQDLLIAWGRTVGVGLSIEALLQRDRFCYGQSLLRCSIDTLCDQGAWEKAASFARHLNEYHRENVAGCWARIGLGLPEGDLRTEALMKAARAGNARPKIQEGGEEASAHGVAITAFARGGLAHDHPAVVVSVKGLLKLADSKAQKSAPAAGTHQAIIAACLRAEADADATWRAIATQLQNTVWGRALDQAGKAATLLADLRLGTVARRSRTDAESVLRAKANGTWHAAGSPEETAAAREAGEDVEAKIAAFLRAWDGYGSKPVAQFVMACRLRLPTERLDALLKKVDEDDRPEALVEGACYGLDGDPRKVSLLERGYPEGDPFGIMTAHLLPFLTPALLERAEEFYGETHCVDGLGLLAAWHLNHGNLPQAVSAISRFTQPKTSGEPWVPRHRRGEAARVFEPAVVDPATLPATLKGAKHARELLALARGLQHEPEALGKVLLTSHLKKWEKPTQFPALIPLRLMEGQLEATLGYLSLASDERDRAEALRLVADHVSDHAEPSVVALEDRWVETFLEILARTHPQWAARAIKQVARAITARCRPAQRASAVERLTAIGKQLYRFEGDRALIASGLSRGHHAAGRIPEARAAMGEALRLARLPAIYLHASVIGADLAVMREGWPRDEWSQRVQEAAEASVGLREQDYLQLEELERIILSLWKSGEVDTVSALLDNTTFPRTLRQDLSRSIWADIDLSPDPLRSLEGSWPREAMPREVLIELRNALLPALRKVGHPEAESVASLWVA